MKLTLAQTATFASLWKQWRLNDEDLQAVERQVMENPLAGRVMRNTGGLRKMRFAPPSRHAGKRGAFRVCYLYFPKYETIYFVLIYPKSEQSTLTPQQEKACRLLSQQIKQLLESLNSR